MKIIYLTDIHDAIEDVGLVLQKNEADLFLLSGDLIYKAFPDDDEVYNFICLQDKLEQLNRELKQDNYAIDLAIDIIRFPEKSRELLALGGKIESKKIIEEAHEYRLLFDQAIANMQAKYSCLYKIINENAKAPVWVLPGNYDMDLRYTELSEHDMHHKTRSLNGLVFAGYGGAPVKTPGIPQKLAVHYHESRKNANMYSEAMDFFLQHRPNVLILHQPVYGYFDNIPGLGRIGSQALRSYVDRCKPSLVLSGHVHEDYGIIKQDSTLFVNSSNFGGVESVRGWEPGGSYVEFYFEDSEVRRLSWCHLKEGQRQLIMDIENHSEGLVASIESTESKTGLALNLEKIAQNCKQVSKQVR